MLNHVSLMGRLTKAPELRQTTTNIPVASFSVAVERDFKKDGEKETDFISCVAWKHTAEFVSKYFDKGSMIALTGRLQVRSYTDKEGNKRILTEVVADNVYFAGAKNAAKPGEFSELMGDDGDLPF